MLSGADASREWRRATPEHLTNGFALAAVVSSRIRDVVGSSCGIEDAVHFGVTRSGVKLSPKPGFHSGATGDSGWG